MYPRNNVSPERIAVGQVVLISDGTIQSTGVAVTVRGQGGAEAGSAGTIAYGADSTVYYTPTQAETNYTSFVLIASKAACFSVSQTIITTAASTAGQVVTDSASRTASQATGFSTFDHTSDTVANVTTVGSVTAQVSADMTAISGDTVAADNLESTFDGTGYTDDAAPSTQKQVGQLSTGSAAISTAAETAVVTVGTETLTYSASANRDGTYHEVDDVGGAMDFYYQFDVGATGVGTSVSLVGRLEGNGDNVDVFAYNWGSTNWDQVGAFLGSNSSTDVEADVNINVAHTGVGANEGKVRVRAYAASGLTTATLFMDQIYINYAIVTDISSLATSAALTVVDTTVDAILVDTVELQTNQGNWVTATGFSTFNAASDAVITDAASRTASKADVSLLATTANLETRTPTAAQLAYIVANAATGMPVTFTTAGGSTTTAALNQVDGTSPEATDDQYNGRLLVFTNGTLEGAVTDITDYVGATTTATITGLPFAPTSSHTARLM